MGQYTFRGFGISVHVSRVAVMSHDEYSRWTYEIKILPDPDDPDTAGAQEIDQRYFDAEDEAERAGRMHGEEIIREEY